jgi:hypothetical protein
MFEAIKGAAYLLITHILQRVHPLRKLWKELAILKYMVTTYHPWFSHSIKAIHAAKKRGPKYGDQSPLQY